MCPPAGMGVRLGHRCTGLRVGLRPLPSSGFPAIRPPPMWGVMRPPLPIWGAMRLPPIWGVMPLPPIQPGIGSTPPTPIALKILHRNFNFDVVIVKI